MPKPTEIPQTRQSRTVREIADGYVLALADLDPTVTTSLGLRPGEDRLPDLSPAGQDAGSGQAWTPDLALDFFTAHSGRDKEFLASEIIRYLSGPGQAISYKLGERAWLAGRAAAQRARAARGAGFDLKAWHMAALSLGSLGLDDLTDELGAL